MSGVGFWFKRNIQNKPKMGNIIHSSSPITIEPNVSDTTIQNPETLTTWKADMLLDRRYDKVNERILISSYNCIRKLFMFDFPKEVLDDYFRTIDGHTERLTCKMNDEFGKRFNTGATVQESAKLFKDFCLEIDTCFYELGNQIVLQGGFINTIKKRELPET